MKKIISVLLVIGLVLSLASCKSTEANKSLYDVYENLSEQGDSGTFDVSFSVKIVDKSGELADEEEAALLKPYKTGKNTYEFYLGFSGAYDEDSQKFSVSLGSDEKSKDDIFEMVNIEGNIYINLKAFYTFVYDLLKSSGELAGLGIELPKWKDLNLDGNYLDLSMLADVLSDMFGLEEKLDASDLLEMFGSMFGLYGDSDYYEDYYDDDYSFEYDTVSYGASDDDYEIEYRYYYGDEDDFDYEYYDDTDAYASANNLMLEEFSAIFANGIDWIYDVEKAIPKDNLKALMDAFEAGLKDAGVISTEDGWYVITLDKNVKKIPQKLAKSLDGNVAENLKAIMDAVSGVETLPDEIKASFAEVDGTSPDDYKEMEDNLIQSLEDADTSDNPFVDGDLKIEAKIKATDKSSAFKLSIDGKDDGASVSLSLSAKSAAESVQISTPTSLVSRANIQGIFNGIFEAFGLSDAA